MEAPTDPATLGAFGVVYVVVGIRITLWALKRRRLQGVLFAGIALVLAVIGTLAVLDGWVLA